MAIAVDANPDAEVIAGLLGVDVEKLAARDRVYQPVARWVALDDKRPIGLATALIRPDDRLFLSCRLTDESVFAPLLDAAVADLDRPVHLSIADHQQDRLRLADLAGFQVEVRNENFEVPFWSALERTGSGHSARVELVQADQVDRDQLFTLDNELRQDVPGCEGWRGDRRWFEDEMTGDTFEPRAYVVARDRAGGQLIGLCRIWRNPVAPTLGLIGVRRTHRTGYPARMLLHAALSAASTWGSETFVAQTAHRSLQRRLRSFGAVQTGETLQLVNRGQP